MKQSLMDKKEIDQEILGLLYRDNPVEIIKGIRKIQDIVVYLKSNGVDVNDESKTLAQIETKLDPKIKSEEIPHLRSELLLTLGSLRFKQKPLDPSRCWKGGMGVIVTLGVIIAVLFVTMIYFLIYTDQYEKGLDSKILFVPVCLFMGYNWFSFFFHMGSYKSCIPERL